MKTQIKINENKTYLLIKSEPYVIFGRMGYVPVIDVEDIHKGTEGYLVISAVSLGETLNEIQTSNKGKLAGLSISLNKENSSRMSRYEVALMD